MFGLTNWKKEAQEWERTAKTLNKALETEISDRLQATGQLKLLRDEMQVLCDKYEELKEKIMKVATEE